MDGGAGGSVQLLVSTPAPALGKMFCRSCFLTMNFPFMNEWMKRNEWRVVDQRTTDVPSLQYIFNMHVNSKLGRQHTKAPLAAALSPFMSWLYHPPHDVNDVMCEGWPYHRGLRPLLFSNSGLPQEPDKCKCCETGPTVFRPYPRRLESLTVCRCHYKGSTFFSFI